MKSWRISKISKHTVINNIKISGMPPLSERENSESTAGLCLILFHAIGVKYINPGHDITHRVPAHRASNRPNAIICKFVRRLIAKDKVMAARKEVTNLQADQLGFTSQVSTIYQPIWPFNTTYTVLTNWGKEVPRSKQLQILLGEGWLVYLRKTDSSEIMKCNTQEDLKALEEKYSE